MPFKTVFSLLVTFITLLIPPSEAAEKANVFVSIPPQKYFIQRIAGDTLDINVMVKAGANPATYEPRPKQMAELSKTRAYFSVGVPFEETWLPRFRAANPDLPVFPTQAGILRVPMRDHLHDDRREEGQAGRPDPHIWLSPRLVILQARNILLGLTYVFPDEAPLFRENYRNFLEEIGTVDTLILELFNQHLARRQFLVFHPSWAYFAEDYGLTQVAIEIEGKAPRQKDLRKLLENGQGWKNVFVQPQFSEKSAKALARDLGAEVIPLDPLAEDWQENLLEAARLIRESLR